MHIHYLCINSIYLFHTEVKFCTRIPFVERDISVHNVYNKALPTFNISLMTVIDAESPIEDFKDDLEQDY